MSLRDYIVIVHPPQQGPNTTMITTAQPPRVVKIQRVGSPQEAASRADVPPGGHGIVVVDGRRFDRAAMAPLVEVELNGQPLPTAEEHR